MGWHILVTLCLWSAVHSPWVRQLSLPLLSHLGSVADIPWCPSFWALGMSASGSSQYGGSCHFRAATWITGPVIPSWPVCPVQHLQLTWLLSNHTGPGVPELGPLLGVLPGYRLLLLLGAHAYLEITAGGVPMLFAAWFLMS